MNDLSTQMTSEEFDSMPDSFEQEPIEAKGVSLAAAGMRAAADIIEKIEGLGAYVGGDTKYISAQSKEEFKLYCRALGRFNKSADDSHFNATREFDGGLKLQVFIAREKVCQRVLLRTEEVPEQVIPAHTKEVYGWDCGSKSVLADKPEELANV